MKPSQRLRSVQPAEYTAASLRIVWWFCAFPNKEWTFNEVCEGTNTAKTTGKVVIEDLVKKGIVAKLVFGRLWRLSANMQSPAYRNVKIVHNLDLVLGSNLVEFIRGTYPQARAIVLFGSYRKGDDVRESDLDIAVEIPGKTQLDVVSVGTIDRLGYREGVNVNAHVFSRETVDVNVFANIANGIVLYGFLEVRPR